jgi:hypothetical protein
MDSLGGQKGQTVKKTKITLATLKGFVETDAYTDDSMPGLAVHREGGWMVTHIKSGKSVQFSGVAPWPLRRQAVAYAQALCRLADWTTENPAEKIQERGPYAGRYIVKRARLAGLAEA